MPRKNGNKYHRRKKGLHELRKKYNTDAVVKKLRKELISSNIKDRM